MPDQLMQARAPGPPFFRVVASLPKIRRARLGFLTDLTEQFGDIARFRMGARVVHVLSHPNLARHVLQDNAANYTKGLGLTDARPLLGKGLLTSEGTEWTRQRVLIEPWIRGRPQDEYVAVVERQVLTLIERWRTQASEGNREVEPLNDTRWLTLSVVIGTLFGRDMSDEEGNLLRQAFSVAGDEVARRMVSPFRPLDVSLLGRRRLNGAVRVLDSVLRSWWDETAGGNGALMPCLSRERSQEQPGQDDHVRDHVVTLLLAGHETTAATIVWCWYLLSKNSLVREKLQAEVAQAPSDGTLTVNELRRLTYVRMVVQEALRLYPPVWAIPRRSIAVDVVGGYRIPAGSEVLISCYAMHRHPDFWDEPETFRPERFAPGQPQRPSLAYLPFGVGPRHCVGNVLGMLEAQAVLALVARHCDLEVVPGTDGALRPLLTLQPPATLRFNLRQW